MESPLTILRLASLISVSLLAAVASGRPARADERIDYLQQIKQILTVHCYQCHGPDNQEAGLRLDSREAAFRGGDSGPALVAGKSDQSEVFRRISAHDEDERMPPPEEEPARPLSPEQIALVKRWIDEGAQWPEDAADAKAASDQWSFRPVVRPDPPAVKNTSWSRNAVDSFVLAKLETKGIEPSPEADRFTLIKRLYYDLLGLPPTPDEVDRFLADRSPDAYATLVDHLLASPHFGERWGRHWLDKARYADSDGYEKDNPRPDAWRYRDWVIQAVNDDLPFDQFTVQQLAGDLLPDASPRHRLATAFHRQTLTNTEGGVDQEEFRVLAVKDRVNTLGTVWLGLTLGCADCHSHKYDRISQREYYQLFAFFNNGDEVNMELPAPEEALAKYEREKASHDARVAEAETKLAADPSNESLKKQIEELKKNVPKPPTISVRVIAQRGSHPRMTHILQRGDFLQPGDAVQPATLELLHAIRPRNEQGPPDRLDLARWLVDPANPLTPRVVANVLWAHLFGRGLVATADDFGVRGEPPTHPELLDWLASELIQRGWSRKAKIKLIVTSATYRQASRHRPELADVDPLNTLLYRQNRWRVEAETVRDLALAASGLLVPKIGGPSVFPPMPADVAAISYADNFKWKASEGEDRYRRGMYTFFKRTAPHPNLTTFDCPDSNITCVRRATSNTPLQALVTLNNEIFAEASQALAKRVLATPGPTTDADRIVHAFRLCMARPPSDAERDRFLGLLSRARAWYAEHPEAAKQLGGRHQPDGISPPEAAAWVATARILMNLDEFITRE